MSGGRVSSSTTSRSSFAPCATNLRGAGYEVTTATPARKHFSGAPPPEAIILDLVLPTAAERTWPRAAEWTQAPIVLVSAVGEEQEKIAALDAGADDYVTKPFAMGELLARLRAVAPPRGPPTASPVIEVGELIIDLEKRR